MLDASTTKLFIFTVQALTSKTGDGRATHAENEFLGKSLYQHLQELNDLIILADEHHCYRGPGFSATLSDLRPQMVVGLTAIPSRSDDSKIVFRYPLAQAIADRLVKTPVVVGRRDDRKDVETQMLDGVNLLKAKEKALQKYCEDRGFPVINPVMMIVAGSIDDATEYQALLDSEAFDGGAWVGKTLLVHSDLRGDEKEKVLAALDSIEEADSPVRIIMSVGMLKEGWDVKNVYVIASMRASASSVLTEQTLGRGLRLAFGEYTDEEFLDTIEVLAHERYSELLKKKDVLNEKFVDYYTFAKLNRRPDGSLFIQKASEPTTADVITTGQDDPPDSQDDAADPAAATTGTGQLAPQPPSSSSSTGPIAGIVTDILTRTDEANEASQPNPRIDYEPLPDRQPIVVPKFVMEVRAAEVSLNEISDLSPFQRLGQALNNDYNDDLKRTKIVAKGAAGSVKVTTEEAEHHVKSAALFEIPLKDSKKALVDRIMQIKGVPLRPREVGAAGRIVDEVVKQMGDNAEEYLSAFGERCASALAREVGKVLGDAHHVQARYDEGIELVKIDQIRTTSKAKSAGHADGAFNKSVAFNGWIKNLYSHTWFDTEPEYKLAAAVDAPDNAVVVWARLHRNDSPITWNADGREYNPDFVVIEESDGGRSGWLVETKGLDRIDGPEVAAKKRAALRWANEANSDPNVDVTWAYLLLGEDAVTDAQGSWEHMKGFAY